MTFETELSDQLHAGVDSTEVDLYRLIEGGRTQGRRFTRRRRIGQVITTTTTVAVIIGAAAFIGPLDRSAVPAIGPAAQVSATTQATVPITPQAAMGILRELLPGDGKLTGYSGGTVGDPAEPEEVWVRPVHTDKLGPSNLSLHLSSGEPAMDCATGETCTQETLPNGDKLISSDSRGPENLRLREVRLLRKDGWQLSLLADNAEHWKERGTRPTPPFTVAQLKSILLSPRWQKSVPAELVTETAGLFKPQRLPANPPRTVPVTSSSTPTPSGSPR